MCLADINQSQLKGSRGWGQETRLREVGIHHSSLAAISCLGRSCLFRGGRERSGNRKTENGNKEPCWKVEGGGVARYKHKGRNDSKLLADTWGVPCRMWFGLGGGGGADGNENLGKMFWKEKPPPALLQCRKIHIDVNLRHWEVDGWIGRWVDS